MGSTGSKIKQIPEPEQPEKVPTTPILTPESKKKMSELDPRSPSTHLSRTPLQLLSAAAEKLEDIKNKELCTPDKEIPAKAKTMLLGIDPRSPTTEFKRTPIVINIEESDIPQKIRNKNLDKVRLSTILNTPKASAEKQGNIPPKLLESSPIRQKPDLGKRKSFVGLLETNIDFTETDLDAVLQEKCKIRESCTDTFFTPSRKICIGIINNENIDPRSPSSDFLRTPIQINVQDDGTEIDDLKVKNKVEEPEEMAVELQNNDLMDKLEIEKIVQETCEITHVENETTNQEACEDENVSDTENILESIEVLRSTPEYEEILIEALDTKQAEIPTETKSAPVTPPTSIIKEQKPIAPPSPIKKQTKSAPVTPPVVNVTADVDELDKKLSNLIYQDEDIVVCPRIVKLKEHSDRSPLRNCNRSETDRRKSLQKLRVNDKPRKSDYAVSKIPVFKEKGKNQIQCENTPPSNIEKRKMKVKKSQWDNADRTLII